MEFTWTWAYVWVPVVALIVVAWVICGAALGILWGSVSQRTDSEIVAILTGIFVIVPLGILQEAGVIALLVGIRDRLMWAWGRMIRLVAGEPPPPPPKQPPWVPRARPPRPEGDVVFDWDTWTWVPREPLDK